MIKTTINRLAQQGFRAVIVLFGLVFATQASASNFGYAEENKREYPFYQAAPVAQTVDQMMAKNEGCQSCHTETDSLSMHDSPGVNLACVDCHGGQGEVLKPVGASQGDPEYQAALDNAHVLPRFPMTWNYPSSRNPSQTYTLLNRESPEFIRFVNPSDLRVAEESCGACHMEIVRSAKRSLMATGALLWGGAAYNNGILPFKNYILGESYTRGGETTSIKGPVMPNPEWARINFGVVPELFPLPTWQNTPVGDVFRVFERGGRNIINLFPETGIPNALGQLQRLEEPGRPDFRQSNRGVGTGSRVAIPIINLTKTRLNDPLMWFMGTNDQAGDFRNSGCAACHVVYANDREWRSSGEYAKYGNRGKSITVDPTIDKTESGHPLKHTFTRAIPTSQCMSCHMHQPNMFLNTYLGYTMWDYESDAPFMWPKEQVYPSNNEIREAFDRNPEGAVARGLWADVEFLQNVYTDINPKLKDTQFADYHGHGWNLRAVQKRDRKGNLLDAEGKIVSNDDPKKFEKAVHMASIHADVGMHCVDCHFSQDNHGNGHVYFQMAEAIEINCQDCHGSADDYPSLKMTGPAAPPVRNDMALLRNPDGKRRFEWIDGKLIQRSLVNPGLEWEMSLVKDTVTRSHPQYNPKAARAKLMSKDSKTMEWGVQVTSSDRAHRDEDFECYTCHTSWTNACGGCHLPIEANWKSFKHHYEGGESRNYATYNPQVARDQLFMIGRRGPLNDSKIAPMRSSSGLLLSSTNAARERIYVQQPPIAASGHSSQAINPHYPHTERKTETKTCTDCHLSEENDNNAIMASLLGLGADYIDFLGFNAYVGTEGEVTAVQVSEWDEPQALIGSYLHKYAYPDWYQQHQDRDQRLVNVHKHDSGPVGCLQLRGEYLYTAMGPKGTRAFDVASIANKGISLRILTTPVGPGGQDTLIPSENATCVTFATTQLVHPARNKGELMREVNQELPFHPIYNYMFITDSKEGLILSDTNTLSNRDPRDNFFSRSLTWNENGILDGARHISMGGYYAYVIADAGLVILNLDNPLLPVVESVLPLNEGRSTHVQFRYVFVTDADGLKVVNITQRNKPYIVNNNTIPLKDAQHLFVARTYAYVAAGEQGIAIIDVEKPEKMKLYQMYNANGQINDARDIVIAHTNASLMGYVADGENGLKVLQLTSPDSQPNFYGFGPAPKPELIAWSPTSFAATSLSRPMERDRVVDETGGQVAVIGRLGARALTMEEQQRLYLGKDGTPYYVKDTDDRLVADLKEVEKRNQSKQRVAGQVRPAADTADEEEEEE